MKREIRKIQDGESENFSELKGYTFEEIARGLQYRNADRQLIIAALEMTNLSPHMKAVELEIL